MLAFELFSLLNLFLLAFSTTQDIFYFLWFSLVFLNPKQVFFSFLGGFMKDLDEISWWTFLLSPCSPHSFVRRLQSFTSAFVHSFSVNKCMCSVNSRAVSQMRRNVTCESVNLGL